MRYFFVVLFIALLVTAAHFTSVDDSSDEKIINSFPVGSIVKGGSWPKNMKKFVSLVVLENYSKDGSFESSKGGKYGNVQNQTNKESQSETQIPKEVENSKEIQNGNQSSNQSENINQNQKGSESNGGCDRLQEYTCQVTCVAQLKRAKCVNGKCFCD